MANYYATVTAERGLKATRDEYNALKVALQGAEEDNECGGFEVEYCDGDIYVLAPASGDWEALSHAFRTLLGTLIANNGLEYLEFGAASASTHPRMGNHGRTLSA